MAAITPFKTIEGLALQPFIDFSNSAMGNIATGVGRPFALMATLYIVFTGLMMLRGELNEPMGAFIMRSTKIVLVASMLSNIEQ